MEKQEHKENLEGKVPMIDIFLQGEGIPEITLINLPKNCTVVELINSAKTKGLPSDNGAPFSVTLEGIEEECEITATIDSVGLHHHGRVHIHRCKKIAAAVNFNGQQKSEEFPPSSTIKHVHHWAVGKKGFNLSEIDASEHALQICGSAIRPDDDTHIGTLARFPNCSICFDLVPKKRVEG